MSTKEKAIPNREYKDRLFRYIFGSDKKFLLSLYNAVNGTYYTNEEDLTYTTLDDVLYMNMKNDISFIFKSAFTLYEHQSSWNPNMPIRGLMYYAELVNDFICLEGLNRYSAKLMELPAPRFFVFYNGEQDEPERTILKLSDSFQPCDHPELNAGYEWTAIVLNINAGKNKELMERCKPLAEYADFVSNVRKYKRNHPAKDAISLAVDDAADYECIGKLLRKCKGDVINMLLTEFNQKEYEDMLRKEYLEEGRAEGRAEGLAEGLAEGQNHTFCVLVRDGVITNDVACEKLGISKEEFQKLLDSTDN